MRAPLIGTHFCCCWLKSLCYLFMYFNRCFSKLSSSSFSSSSSSFSSLHFYYWPKPFSFESPALATSSESELVASSCICVTALFYSPPTGGCWSFGWFCWCSNSACSINFSKSPNSFLHMWQVWNVDFRPPGPQQKFIMISVMPASKASTPGAIFVTTYIFKCGSIYAHWYVCGKMNSTNSTIKEIRRKSKFFFLCKNVLVTTRWEEGRVCLGEWVAPPAKAGIWGRRGIGGRSRGMETKGRLPWNKANYRSPRLLSLLTDLWPDIWFLLQVVLLQRIAFCITFFLGEVLVRGRIRFHQIS